MRAGVGRRRGRYLFVVSARGPVGVDDGKTRDVVAKFTEGGTESAWNIHGDRDIERWVKDVQLRERLMRN